jgi:hypothetical protein
MFSRIILTIAVLIFAATHVEAGTLSDLMLTDAVKSLDPAERAARGGIGVSLWVILFYIFYLGTIWAFNVAMLFTEGQLAPARRKFAKYFCRANIFLAAGDTAMFIAFLTAYLFPDAFNSPDSSQKLMQLLLLGVFTTSLTMSVYYAYLGFYYRERFGGGAWDVILLLIIVFFVIRLVLHYNPDNVWFSMTLPPGQPNYSSWLRNTPLFLYGLGAVLVVGYLSWKNLQQSKDSLQRLIDWCIIGAMCALLFSFAMYALDVFYSHKIPHAYIWIIYTLKTLAYMLAFFLMWLGEFHFGRRLPA